MKKTAILLTIAFALVSLMGFAQTTKVVVLDMDKVMRETKIGKDMTAKLRKEQDTKEAALKSRQEKILDIQKKVQSQASVLTESKRLELKQQYEKLQLEYNEFLKKSREEILQLQQNMNKEYNDKLMPVLQTLSKEKGYDIVLDKRLSVFVDDKLDITNEFIVKVNAAIK